MSRFNIKAARPLARPKDVIVADAVNHEGGHGYTPSQASELYNLATVNFVGQDTFYESAEVRDARYNSLVASVAVGDGPWVQGMLPWLRSEAGIRTASLTGAAHAVHARLAAKLHERNAELIDGVILRADEVAEFLSYWRITFGRSLPKAVRKGLGMAMRRLYTARNALKWDSSGSGLRFADVIEIVHPRPRDEEQAALWRYLLDQRHHKDGDVGTVPLIAARKNWYASSDAEKLAALKDGSAFRRAGLTWENASSELKSRVGEKALWEAMAPHLPIGAAIKNLRNMDEAGIPYAASAKLGARIADPEEVKASRELPYRFLTAYLAAPSDRWKQPLEEAINASLASVPELPGRTLVLVDTSASMTTNYLSKKSKVTSAQAACLFGAILAQRNPGRVDLYGFADYPFKHDLPKGQGVLGAAGSLMRRTNEAGYGTRMTESIRQTFQGHDRIFIISDMQCFGDDQGRTLTDGNSGWNRTSTPIPVPDSVKVYGINIGGARTTAIDTRVRNRFEFSGLTDQVFRQVLALEAGYDEKWPWLS